jgi:hypothetical protein
MKRNTPLIIIVAVAAIFLLWNPFKSLTGNRNAVNRPPTDAAAMAPLVQYAEEHWRSPEDYLLATLERRDVVFLGEYYKISQNTALVKRLIPRLYGAGIRNLGIEYALSDDQADIDALVTAPQWDEAKARAIIFDWVVTWGYQEYVDLYKAAWEVNRARPAGSPPFRIVGLSARQDWSVLTSQQDMSDPAVVSRMYAGGLPEAHMADVIDRMFLQTGQKALIYCGTRHIFTRYRNTEYEKNAAKMNLSEVRLAGNILYEKAPLKVASVALNGPWPDPGQSNGLGYPAGGVVDALIDLLPEDKRNAGWDLVGTPLGGVSIKDSTYATAAATTLADMFDGYIVLGPIRDYKVVTPIPDFVRPQDAERAVQQFPNLKPANLTAEQVQAAISQDVDALQKALDQFR